MYFNLYFIYNLTRLGTLALNHALCVLMLCDA